VTDDKKRSSVLPCFERRELKIITFDGVSNLA
jgi:hypothetical protein